MTGVTRSPAAPDRPEAAAFGRSQLLPLVTDLSGLLALASALLYYFGWVRTRNQARSLGYDGTLLDLGVTDYILKSLNVLFVPLTLSLVVVLVCYLAHRRYVVGSDARGTAFARRIARQTWILWLPVAAVVVALVVSPAKGYALPVGLTLAIVCELYVRAIRRRLTGTDPWPAVVLLLALTLLAVGGFWTTERVARTMGRSYAADFAERPDQLAAVTIYSGKDLGLEAPGVARVAVSGSDTAYAYRYTGLRLLERSGDKYFLVTEAKGSVIMLRESDDLRMEFANRP